MKTIMLFICFVSVIKVNGQFRVNSNFNVVMDTINLKQYKVPELDKEFDLIKLAVGFGDFEILNKAELKKIKNAAVVSVDLVYTQFPEEENFKELNSNRLEYLHLHLPELFTNSAIQWRLVAQHGCSSASKAASMFHGFVIVYRPGPTLETARAERKEFKVLVRGKKSLGDSTIFKILKRNKNKFNNAAIVADFTGSMSPYIIQLLVWYELNFSTNKFSEFVFFNDGDLMLDEKKVVGKTGGLYYCDSKNRDTVLNKALECISKGFGGDLPENNLEAVLFALNKNPNIKEIIMVADNYATPRDLALVNKIKVPIHIIICGNNMGINPRYLEIAHSTKGSLHTIEQDIDRLMDLQDGKTIKIGKQEFILQKGKFIPVFKS
jgi:hypothetical protein